MTGRRPRTRIKICGITTPEAAVAAVEAGADALGLVFAEGSPRRLDLDRAAAILAVVPPLVARVVVHRDADPALIDATSRLPGITAIQLHGREDEASIATCDRPVIRGIAFDPDAVRRWDAAPGVAALLVDGPVPGTGASFDHAALAALLPALAHPVILAGGLTPDSVGAAVRAVQPYAVDVSSGVESAPGRKDPARIRAFCAAVRAADASG